MPATPPVRLPVQQPSPARSVERLDEPAPVERPGSPIPVRTAAEPVVPARPLYNKAVPPEPRPSFDAQQKAIQTTDPGRPLSPQQLENLRQSQPVGRPQQAEKPHPVPAPKAAPAAARPAPPPPAEKKH